MSDIIKKMKNEKWGRQNWTEEVRDTIQGDGTKLGGMRRKLTEKATLGSRHGGSGADPHSNLTWACSRQERACRSAPGTSEVHPRPSRAAKWRNWEEGGREAGTKLGGRSEAPELRCPPSRNDWLAHAMAGMTAARRRPGGLCSAHLSMACWQEGSSRSLGNFPRSQRMGRDCKFKSAK